MQNGIGLEVLLSSAPRINDYLVKLEYEGYPLQRIGIFFADREIETVHGSSSLQIERSPVFKSYRVPYPEMNHCIAIKGDELSTWPKVLSAAEWLAETYKGIIYSPHTQRSITSFLETTKYNPTAKWPSGRLAVLRKEKQAYIEKWALEKSTRLAYQAYLSLPNIFFAESGHLLKDEALFGRELPPLKDSRGRIHES